MTDTRSDIRRAARTLRDPNASKGELIYAENVLREALDHGTPAQQLDACSVVLTGHPRPHERQLPRS